MIGILIKRRYVKRQNHRERPCKDRRLEQVSWAKECQRSPANHQQLEEGEMASLTGIRGSMALPTPQCQASSLQDFRKMKACCFKPPCLSCFVLNSWETNTGYGAWQCCSVQSCLSIDCHFYSVLYPRTPTQLLQSTHLTAL